MFKDMSPIEYLWDNLDRKVRLRNPPPRNLAQLRQALIEEWHRYPQFRISNNVNVSPDSESKACLWFIHPLLRNHINSNFCVRRKSDLRFLELSRLRTYVL